MKAPIKSTHISGDDTARIHAAAAIEQLSRSERGFQALCDFAVLYENGGNALDGANWGALRDLCELGAAGKGFAIAERLPAKNRR